MNVNPLSIVGLYFIFPFTPSIFINILQEFGIPDVDYIDSEELDVQSTLFKIKTYRRLILT